MDRVCQRRKFTVHRLADVCREVIEQRLVRFQAGHAVLRAPQADMSRRVVEVDNVRRLSRQAHCHGRAIRIRLSHQAEVASVVVDNNLRHACCGCSEKPVPLAERLCADQLVHFHNDARGTHRGQKASGRVVGVVGGGEERNDEKVSGTPRSVL